MKMISLFEKSTILIVWKLHFLTKKNNIRFPVNFAKFLRTPFPIEHLWWLLLILLLFHSPKRSWSKSAKYEEFEKYWSYCTCNRAITNAYFKNSWWCISRTNQLVKKAITVPQKVLADIRNYQNFWDNTEEIFVYNTLKNDG